MLCTKLFFYQDTWKWPQKFIWKIFYCNSVLIAIHGTDLVGYMSSMTYELSVEEFLLWLWADQTHLCTGNSCTDPTRFLHIDLTTKPLRSHIWVITNVFLAVIHHSHNHCGVTHSCGFFSRKHEHLFAFSIIHFSTLRWQNYIFLMEGKDLVILRNQYHCCWCPGDARSQGISSYGINLFFSEYSGFIPRRANNLT